MVKFGKTLRVQQVPEWAKAYVDYVGLKTLLRAAKRAARQEVDVRNLSSGLSLTSIPTNLPAAQALALIASPHSAKTNPGWKIQRAPSVVDIVVLQVKGADGKPDDVIYQTQVSERLPAYREESAFFAKLDQELNMVNAFFAKEEKELVQRFEDLIEQLRRLKELAAGEDTRAFPEQVDASAAAAEAAAAAAIKKLPRKDPGSDDEDDEAVYRPRIDNNKAGKEGEIQPGEVDRLVGRSNQSESEDVENVKCAEQQSARDVSVTLQHSSSGEASTSNRKDGAAERSGRKIANASKVAGFNILEGVKAAFEARSEPSVKLKRAREQLKMAFRELYRALEFLKNYSSLNALAFGKILKKHDKVMQCQTWKVYMAAVNSSHFQDLRLIKRMLTSIESDFATRFTHGKRKKAMQTLRPTGRKTHHATTFFLGAFVGFEVCLVVVLLVIIYANRGFAGGPNYTTTVFPFYRAGLLLMLHGYLYGGVLLLFKHFRINYPFIFDFAPGTDLKPVEVLAIAAALTTPLLGGQALQLLIATGSSELSGYLLVDIIPMVLAVAFLAVLFCPFNILYRSSRKFFLSTLVRLMCAPFISVKLPDFFLGDQLTSQVRYFYDMQFAACYYISGSWQRRDSQYCRSNAVYINSSYVVGCAPYAWRLLQCLRRFRDEDSGKQLVNAGKYLLAMLVIGSSLLFQRERTTLWTVLYIAISDWGLLQRHSVHPWLRDELILPPAAHWVYFVAIVVNLMLRLVWTTSIVPSTQLGAAINYDVLVLLFAALEVIRRSMWNFFRIENEHLTNVGKFRAVKQIPLPFDMDNSSDEQ
eukprot:jgi/Chlat1/6769/Chrsp50S06485